LQFNMAAGTSMGNAAPATPEPLQGSLDEPVVTSHIETVWDVAQLRRLTGSQRRETQQHLGDWVLASLCTIAILGIFSMLQGGNLLGSWANWMLILLYPFLVVTCCSQQNLYHRLPSQDLLEDSFRTIKAVALASLLLVGLHYLYANHSLPRTLLLTMAVVNALALVGWRNIRRRNYEKRVLDGKAGTHVLIVGAGAVGCALAEFMQANRNLGYVFKGFVDYDPTMHSMIRGRVVDLPKIACEEFVDEVFVTLPPKSALAKEAILKAREMCLDVTIVPELFDDLGFQAPLEYLGNVPIMELHREPIPAVGLFIKRLIDVVFGALALVVAIPAMTLLALIIYLDSPGPIFYTSARVGKKGRVFSFHKFRSMVVDADTKRLALAAHNKRDGILFKMENDPRVTRVGTFIRKYSLDELPQIWNVLKGEMSLVGPRPPLVSEYLSYRAEHRRRLDVVPGITGLWQVSGRTDPSFEYYVAQDLKYIENWSLLLDLKILFKTVPAVLRGTGV
jgi:exopolysaccharide biosynthesis polyprenyl glycosylphosphotransferase